MCKIGILQAMRLQYLNVGPECLGIGKGGGGGGLGLPLIVFCGCAGF